jgi:hypothetical protein
MEPGEWLIVGSALAVVLGCRVLTRKFLLKSKIKDGEVDHTSHHEPNQ